MYHLPGQAERRPTFQHGVRDDVLRRLEIPAVPHGFRSSFRDWMGECTGASWAVAESALAHSSGERASLGYHRTDYLEQRRPLMEEWAKHVAGEAE